MTPRCVMLPSDGRLPWAGHLACAGPGWAAAIRVGRRHGPLIAWDAVCSVQATLAALSTDPGPDWLTAAWAALGGLGARLGPAEGDDLSAILLSTDDRGHWAACAGLSHAWRYQDGALHTWEMEGPVEPGVAGTLTVQPCPSPLLVGLCAGSPAPSAAQLQAAVSA